MEWIQSVQCSLNYIEANLLDEELSNDNVARHAYSSNGNFQRIFSIVNRCDKINVDFFTYEVYVLNLATNSGGSQEFLEKAQELNPDFSFLADVRKQYRIINYLWNGGYWIKDVHTTEERDEMKKLYGDYNLKTLGGAFGCKFETLQDREKRAPIVKQIRRMADCMDEVVRILNENLLDNICEV